VGLSLFGGYGVVQSILHQFIWGAFSQYVCSDYIKRRAHSFYWLHDINIYHYDCINYHLAVSSPFYLDRKYSSMRSEPFQMSNAVFHSLIRHFHQPIRSTVEISPSIYPLIEVPFMRGLSWCLMCSNCLQIHHRRMCLLYLRIAKSNETKCHHYSRTTKQKLVGDNLMSWKSFGDFHNLEPKSIESRTPLPIQMPETSGKWNSYAVQKPEEELRGLLSLMM